MREVMIAGVGMTAFGKYVDRGLRSLSEEAVSAALADAAMTTAAIEAVYFANAAAGVVTGQEMIRGQAALRFSGLAGRPIFNVENACASGSSALHLAWLAVASGQLECALVIGAEKLTHPDKRVSFAAFAKGVDLEEPEPMPTGQGSGTLFMDIYAQKARRWMRDRGATPEDIARVVVKSRRAASLNPQAQFRQPTDVAEVLGSRMISEPLTLFMCSSIGDGAAAIVVSSDRIARKFGAGRVRVLASVVTSATCEPGTENCAVRAARLAYEAAGVGPGDVDVAEVHDAAAPAELIRYEQLGLCAVGDAVRMLRDGTSEVGGRLPVNPSGGLLSRGHPVGATGAAQIVEITRQLRGQCGQRQREGARIGLAENGGGHMAGDAAVGVVTILGK